jgi:hypothetical protein
MKIQVVQYKQKFPTGSFLNCDIGFEASIGENENPEVALKDLQSLAESFHKSSFSYLYTESGKPVEIKQVDENEQAVDKRIAAIIQDINQCTAIDEKNGLGVQVGLLSFAEVASKNPEIKAAYDLKLLQLQK